MQLRSDTCRSYFEPSHGPVMETSTVIPEKELSGKTKSTSSTVRADKRAENIRFANGKNHTNNCPSKGIFIQTNVNANS